MQGTTCLLLALSFLMVNASPEVCKDICRCSSRCINYTVFFSEPVYPGMNVSYSITFRNVSNSIKLMSRIYSDDNMLDLRKNVTIRKDETVLVSIGKIPFLYSGSENVTFIVTAIDEETEFFMFTEVKRHLTFTEGFQIIGLQTDKRMYKPEDLVNFRAIILSKTFHPLFGNVTYEIRDPNGNVTFQRKDVRMTHGVITDKMQLSNMPLNGTWNFTIYYYRLNKTISFMVVNNYTRPKFLVTLKTPLYITPTSKGFWANLTSFYPNGEKMKGNATLLIAMKEMDGKIINSGRITKFFPTFNGLRRVFVSKKEIMHGLNWDGVSRKTLHIAAYVEEAVTSLKYNYTTFINITSTNIKVNLLSKPKLMKPRLPYDFHVWLTEIDYKPLDKSDIEDNNVLVRVIYKDQFAVETTKMYVFKIESDGVAYCSFTPSEENFVSANITVFTNKTESLPEWKKLSWWMPRAQSLLQNFIKISSNYSRFYAGNKTKFNITTTEIVESIAIMIIARGELVEVGVTRKSSYSDYIHEYSWNVTHRMVPFVRIMAYYMNIYGEIIPDERIFKVFFTNLNWVNTTSKFEEDYYKPRENIKINVTSTEHSHIFIQSIDKKYRQFPKESFYDVLFPSFGNRWNQSLLTNYECDPYSIITSTRFSEITNVQVPSRDCFNVRVHDEETWMRQNEYIKLDAEYPMTWLWEKKMNEWNQSVTFEAKIPEYFTTWQINCFSLSQQYGLGIAEPVEFKVYQYFYVSLDLPSEMTQDEIAIAKVLVYNYYKVSLTVKVSLILDNMERGVEIVTPELVQSMKDIVVPPNDIMVLTYPLKFNMMGYRPIRVRAVVNSWIQDDVEKSVFVKPKGIRKEFFWTSFINEKFSDWDSQPSLKWVNVTVPSDVIEGSTVANLTIYSDLAGLMIQHYHDIWLQPKGSTQLNLMPMAAVVFGSLYQRNIRNFTWDMQQEAYDLFTRSFMNQLRYMHKNGACSTYGEAHSRNISTELMWLTAMVTKCFAFATELNPDLVDMKIMNRSIFYLLSEQRVDGSFSPINCSGTFCSMRYTAFVVIAMQETNLFKKNMTIRNAMMKARMFMESNMDFVNDPYTWSLVTYAFHLTFSPMAQRAFERFQELSETIDGMTFWRQWHFPTTPQQTEYLEAPEDIESASYAILIYVIRKDFDLIMPVMKWLISKQISFGRFSTSQNSIIAWQAVTKAAEIWFSPYMKLNVTTTVYENDWPNTTWVINETSSFRNYSVMVPRENQTVWIRSSGVGMAVAQLFVSNNVPPKTDESERIYNCSSEVTGFNKNATIFLNFCCRPKQRIPIYEPILYKIYYMNGFVLNESRLRELNPDARNIEINKDCVIFYYDQLVPDDYVCATVYQTKRHEVAAFEPANITVWEFTKPTVRNSMLIQYNVSNWNETTVCDVCGVDCEECPEPQMLASVTTPCVDVCRNETALVYPKCFDTSRNVMVHPSMCQSEEIYSDECSKESFTCPYFYDGLWYQLPESFGFFNTSKCQVMGNLIDSPYDIPGSELDGETSYIDCGNDHVVLETGLTYSFLVKFSEYPQMSQQIYFLYLGKTGNSLSLPVVSFVWTHSNNLALKVNYKNTEYITVYPQDPSHVFPVDSWKMLTVTWSPNEVGKIYINGQPLEVHQSSHPLSIMSTPSTTDLTFYVGFAPSDLRPGYINGALSGLTYWHEVLSASEVQSFYSFLSPLVEAENQELSPRQLQYFSPRSVSSCFVNSTILSLFYDELPPMCDFDPYQNTFGFSMKYDEY